MTGGDENGVACWPKDRSPKPCNAILSPNGSVALAADAAARTGSELLLEFLDTHFVRFGERVELAVTWERDLPARVKLVLSNFRAPTVGPGWRVGQVVATPLSGRSGCGGLEVGAGDGFDFLDEEAEAQCAGDDDGPGE